MRRGSQRYKGLGHRIRVEMALNFERPYRTPVQNFSNITAVHSGGYRFKDARDDPALSARLAIRFAKMTHSDFVKPALDPNALLIDAGLDVRQPDDDYGRVTSPLIKGPEDIDRLELYDPLDPRGSPTFTDRFIDNVSMVAETMDEDFHVTGVCWGPLTIAGLLRGTEDLMMDIIYEPDLVRELVSKAATFCEGVQLRYIDAGATAFWMSDPTASEDMISSEMFMDFAFGGIRQVCTNVKDETKVPIMVHVCGNTMGLMEHMPDAGVDCFSCDAKVDLVAARGKVGRKMSLMGNVDPSGILWQGIPASVREVSYGCIEDAGLEGGFILAPGCESPRDCPDENMVAMGMAGIDRWML